MSNLRTAILQVGYERNKAGYKFTEIDDAFPLFKVAQQIWKSEVGDNHPGFTKREFPIVLSAAKEVEVSVEEAISDPVDTVLDMVGEQSALPVTPSKKK